MAVNLQVEMIRYSNNQKIYSNIGVSKEPNSIIKIRLKAVLNKKKKRGGGRGSEDPQQFSKHTWPF